MTRSESQQDRDRRKMLVAAARDSIAKGSKSFALASRLFDRETRERVWLLYAWCRACDDLADDQVMGGKLGDKAGAEERLETIRRLTAAAFAGEQTGEPAFDALGVLAREVPITQAMADDVIAGFALDTAGWRPETQPEMLLYCFHVAGAVGVMMAVVMGVDPADEDALDRACDLGIGFQLANIARDVSEDAAAGRCYLPVDWLEDAGVPAGEMMEPQHRLALVAMVGRLCDLQAEYDAAARMGAARLGFRQRWAVLAAAGIYGAIAHKVERAGALAWRERVYTSSFEKLGHVARACFSAMRAPEPAYKPRLSRRDLKPLAWLMGDASVPGS